MERKVESQFAETLIWMVGHRPANRLLIEVSRQDTGHCVAPPRRGRWFARFHGGEGLMTDQEKEVADRLLSRIETATGELPTRDGAAAPLITEILSAVNGLRTVIGVERSH